MAFEIKCRGSCRSSRARSGHHLVCRSGDEPPGPWRERAGGDPRRFHPRPGGVAAQRRLRVGRTSALHPRARGAARSWRPRSLSAWGSSPRARGGPMDTSIAAPRGRFIPARAGRSGTSRRSCRGRRVHPRARGAVPRWPFRTLWHSGSSPYPRGGQRGPSQRLLHSLCGSARFRVSPQRPDRLLADLVDRVPLLFGQLLRPVGQLHE